MGLGLIGEANKNVDLIKRIVKHVFQQFGHTYELRQAQYSGTALGGFDILYASIMLT